MLIWISCCRAIHSSTWDSWSGQNRSKKVYIHSYTLSKVRTCSCVSLFIYVYKLSILLVNISSFLCRWISCKEIDVFSIKKMRILAIEIVCMTEKAFPTSILSTQIHILVHVVDEVAIARITNTMVVLSRMFYENIKSICMKKGKA